MDKLKNIQLVSFDMDGTLIDDEWAHERAKTEIARSIGADGDLDLPMFTGRSNRKFWEHICNKYNIEGDIEELTRRQFVRVYELCAEKNQPASYGIVEALKHFKSKGITVAIASGSDEFFIDKILDYLGLTSYFDIKVYKELVRDVKPAPDIYIKACELADVPAEFAVGIEDSNSGCTALHGAGMKCIGYTNRGANPQTLTEADYKIGTMLELMDII